MDPGLYTAAQAGNWDAIGEFKSQLRTELTPERNNVLHVLAQFCKSSSTVEQTLQRHPELIKKSNAKELCEYSFAVEQIFQRHPELIKKSNAKGETAVHIAARKGHLKIVRALIVRAKVSEENFLFHMLCSQSKNGNLPLHEAVENNHGDIVQLLVQEDPTLVHKINNANESPLYLAVEKGYHSLAAVMLSSLVNPSSCEIEENLDVLQTGNGPDMKSILHAAAIRNCKDCTQVILEKLPHLTKVVDKFGWTPLHYAARSNYLEVARQLLGSDDSMANVRYKRNVYSEVSEETALHVAVARGHLHMVQEILCYNPNCWEKVTDHGKNVIHLAVENEQKEVLDFILSKSWASKLINQKDVHGNTPLHLYATARNLFGSNLINHPAVDRNALNNSSLTALDLIKSEMDLIRRRQSELETIVAHAISGGEDKLCNSTADDNKESSEIEPNHAQKRMFNAHVLVAALVLTISFAAVFTLPGGFDTNDGPRNGLAILEKKAAFSTYIVCVTVGMFLSWLSLVLLVTDCLEQEDPEHMDMLNSYVTGGVSSLLIAFVSGLYVTVPVLGIRIFIIFLAVVSGGTFLSLARADEDTVLVYLCKHA